MITRSLLSVSKSMRGRRWFSAQITEQIRPEVRDTIFEVLRGSPKCDTGKLVPTARFTDLGFDSLDVVELVVAFEERLGFDLPGEVAEGKIETVQDALIAFSKFYPTQLKPE